MKRLALDALPAPAPVAAKHYEAAATKLREALLDAQFDLFQDGRFPVMVLVEGFDGAGKGETINLLNEWMDPRHLRTVAFGEPTPEERAHPDYWRYWQALPRKGRIGILSGHWYARPLRGRAFGSLRRHAFDDAAERIVRFERTLAAEGALIVKLWFYLRREAQEARLSELESNPLTRWRVTREDWQHYRHYRRFLKTADRLLRATSLDVAPWQVVDGTDAAYRNLAVGRTLLEAMRARLDAPRRRRKAAPGPPGPRSPNVLAALDLSRKLGRRSYEDQLERLQARLNALSRHPRFRKRSAVLVFEGQDAAGKGGSIRRVTRALDARQYHVVPIAAPSEEERAFPYLWRFWREVPRHGHIAIFDRSWYGRVLVERVEDLIDPADWARAYGEINEFERQLAEDGAIIAKYWLAISKAEQRRRFDERQRTAHKRFKISPEDWRNRARWDAYEAAVCDMVARTSTAGAPWTLVEADDKPHARIKVLRTLCERLERALDG